MNNKRIASIHARQLIDCKCRPLVEVDVRTEGGALGRGSAPTGSSVGMYEAVVLRDGTQEYHGLSVHKAVDNVNHIIAQKLLGMDVENQAAIDNVMRELDGTDNKANLGANAIYSTSIACFRAAAEANGVPLFDYIAKGKLPTVPIPSFNVINGGNNHGIKQAFNEFIITPYRAQSIYEAVEIAVAVFQQLGKTIRRFTGSEPLVGGSYGWCAPSEDARICLSLMQEAIDTCGYHSKCAFAFDCASSEMYDKASGLYYYNGKMRTDDELIEIVKGLTEMFPFVFVEDLLDENNWNGFEKAHRRLEKTLVIADDFTVTNKARIQKAIDMNAIDGFILKPNQVGTITEALEAYQLAHDNGLLAIPSGRSGGVIGDVVMDLAAGLQVPFIKNGCPRSGERIDKLNFLMRIADSYPGCKMANIDSIVKF
jgi:enolase